MTDRERKDLLEALVIREVTYVQHRENGKVYKVLTSTDTTLTTDLGELPLEEFRVLVSNPIFEKGLLIGFHIVKQGDPPPTFGMDPGLATHLELLEPPVFGESMGDRAGLPTRNGVYLLAIWPDKTTYLCHWDKESVLAHLARAGVVPQELGRVWSSKLQKEILAQARPRPAFRALN